jgi:hypothetical protein
MYGLRIVWIIILFLFQCTKYWCNTWDSFYLSINPIGWHGDIDHWNFQRKKERKKTMRCVKRHKDTTGKEEYERVVK